MKRSIFLLLILFPLSLFAAPLRIGMELCFPPFETISPDGKPTGISVDLANALGKYLNREVKIESCSFVGLIPALKEGKIDLVISSMTVTDERKKSIDFSDSYGAIGLSLLVNSKSALIGIDELNAPGYSIVVRSGTTGEAYARKHLTKAKIHVFESESSCVLEIVQNKADAFLYDQLSVYKHWQRNIKKTRAILTPFHKESFAIGIRKGNQQLLDQVNLFLKKFRAEGGFKQLTEKYLKKEQSYFQKLNIPFIF